MRPVTHRVLARSASGLRHLRWAREVLGTLHALSGHASHFTSLQKAAIQTEVAHVTSLLTTLSAAVKAYRDFLERTRTKSRGKVRAAELLVSAVRGVETIDRAYAARALESARSELNGVTEPERRALHATLGRAIDDLRTGLAAMDDRLAAAFSPEVAAAVYPQLTADAARVHDDGDPDDDAAGNGSGGHADVDSLRAGRRDSHGS
ncbi:MAG: hypothetical protein U0441_26920 [Polyangiaceae bacterium]